jgi:hypothetical protein
MNWKRMHKDLTEACGICSIEGFMKRPDVAAAISGMGRDVHPVVTSRTGGGTAILWAASVERWVALAVVEETIFGELAHLDDRGFYERSAARGASAQPGAW